ncbi:MAG: hypothetical protein K6D37_11665 [Prevotella sp.]|nr:hypothetical protein [Prevotella sp.]
MKKTLTLLLIVAYVNAFAQLSTNEEPIGYKIIDGGTLSNVDVELKAGASLIILNSGVLETRYGFLAPVGAIVDVESGQII